MDRETVFSGVENPWIPVTPAKQQPISEAKQENYAKWASKENFPVGSQSDQANLLESESFSTNLLQGIQAHGVASSSGLARTMCTSRNFDNGEAALATNSKVHNFFLESADNLRNFPCQSLLALADAATAMATTYSGKATTQCNDNVTSSSFPATANSSTSGQDQSCGSNFGANICNANISQYGYSVPGPPSFDPNSPPMISKNAAASSRIFSEFAPMTPEAKHREGKTSITPNLWMDERAPQDTTKQTAEVGSEGIKVHQLHQKEQLEVSRDSTLASVTTQLQEDHNPDKGINLVAYLIKTPPQKPRRKKHRPKVVIEGQTRTPKPTAPKPKGPKEASTEKRKYVRRSTLGQQTAVPSAEATSRVENPVKKRKYVRRKGIDRETPIPLAEAISGMETPKQQRKYVRRIRLNKGVTTPLDEAIDGMLNPLKTGYATKSCRRSLNFDSKSQVGDERLPCKASLNIELDSGEQNIYAARLRPRTKVQLGEGLEVAVEKTKVGIAYDLACSMNQELSSYLSMTEQPSTIPSQSRLTANGLHERIGGRCQIVFSDETHDKDASSAQNMLNTNTQSSPRSPNESNCSTSACLTTEQASGQKREQLTFDQSEHGSTKGIGNYCNFQQAYPAKSPLDTYSNENSRSMFLPTIYKKKRTEKGQNSETSSLSCMMYASRPDANSIMLSHNCRISADQVNTTSITTQQMAASNTHHKYNFSECLLALSNKERKTKKRSKGHTQVHNSISLIGILKHMQKSTYARKPSSDVEQTFELPSQPYNCMEAVVADTRATMSKKKRTKRNFAAISMPANLYAQRQFCNNLIGPPLDLRWKNVLSVDTITEQLKHLDINQESNALVIYQRDGTLVPLDPIKQRPKVDLDDETNRVWKLLLQDIDSEGIDGTDAEKIKWWKEERRVFQGRADSFIARMHLVQGDRRFSPWKGSVVDSVIGVFLTQNVSDHLSSSAFMSLGARYPLQTKTFHESFHEEGTSAVVQEPQEVECTGDREIINSNESSGRGTLTVDLTENSNSRLFKFSNNSLNTYHESASSGSATEITGTAVGFMADQRDNIFPSQNSVVLSRSSVNISNAELTAMSKIRVFDVSTSFLELLQKAGNGTVHEVLNQVGDDMSSNKDGENQSESACDLLKHTEKPQDPRDSLGHVISSSTCSLHLSPNGASEFEKADFLGGRNIFTNIFKVNEENCASEQSGSTAESASLPSIATIMTTASQEVPGFAGENDQACCNLEPEVNKNLNRQRMDSRNNIISQIHSHMQQIPNATGLSRETLDVLESNSNSNDSTRMVESNMSDDCKFFLEKEDGKNADIIEPKKDRIRKDKERAYDWDSLRKHTQVDGKKRERTANTMDSVDWEAVRHADVEEIADAIKARGMNNVLAERIKDFLNRLVREHGSIDLEWIRDIPPDKAKEYLLSFWGLGLKSVECVRLLTLHHLAFPVDTNVGRIAVRLGWVPIQPLPESLQLHLLELYPVLESIQKYLWPRLCRLDQKTLYELHYQMITFGKVFCTKSKPNCNACPMRGECRHFASAFASARLALPAPEDKSIVDATGVRAANPNAKGIINPLQLLHHQTGQLPNMLSEGTSRGPIIEEPVTPGPIIEEPATPEPEQTHVSESDIEDIFYEDPDEIPTIKLNIEEFAQNLQNYMQQNMELQDVDMSKALVALMPQAASIPMPRLKSLNRLRTEHQVYLLPDSHPLLEGLEKREPDDLCPYLLAIWAPGETANSIQPPERQCSSQEPGKLCNKITCFSCNSLREANSQTVRGTLLIPCRTAMRGSFPLNGTYFQVNEVFADHNSSLNPIDVPRDWLWNLPRRIGYFGTSIPTIFRGLTTEEIQQCFWRGFVCMRGFDRKTRAPRPLMARLHFPASKLTRTRGKADEN